MVDPLFYQDQAAPKGTKLDLARDNTSLPLAVAAVAGGVPLLGICRGFQEMNVAFGGSLHQELHQHGQFFDHRENKEQSLEQQYGDAHRIKLTPKGQLATLLDESSITVNSLHTQGVDRLADNLSIEAVSEDGLIEAFSVANAKTFAMAFQWHPEWKVDNNKHSTKLFHAFGQACLAKKTMRDNHE
jgi:putative glutamine amidotransferase